MFRTIVLQNESVDDGIEHFEDIVENPEDPAIASTNLDKQDGMSVSLEKFNSDDEDGSDTMKQAEVAAGDEKGETNAPAEGSTLHVLYNPRHREPSYWYCLFNPIFCINFQIILFDNARKEIWECIMYIWILDSHYYLIQAYSKFPSIRCEPLVAMISCSILNII